MTDATDQPIVVYRQRVDAGGLVIERLQWDGTYDDWVATHGSWFPPNDRPLTDEEAQRWGVGNTEWKP